MSDDTATPTPADVAPEQPAEQAESPSWEDLFKGEDPVKVREALEHARKWEKRAKENKAAADRAADLERESQTAEERIAALEKRYQDAEAARLRADVASRYSIPAEDRDLFLTGTDEDTLVAQARRLAERDMRSQNTSGNYVPREGTNPRLADNPDLEVVRGLFGSTT